MGRAILFDLFETLMTEMAGVTSPSPPSWGAPGPQLGISDDAFRRAWTDRKARRMTSTFSYVDALTDICSAHGVEPPLDVIHMLNDARQSHRAQAFAAVPVDVLDMLDRLRAAGCAIAVVSNCSVEESEHIAGSPLAARVDAIVWSFEEGVQKPDPAIYRFACERLGADASQTTFVGDGSFDELRGAQEAGLRPVWASWFTTRWPPHLAEQRRAEVDGLGFVEAAAPRDVLALVDALRM